MASSQQGLGVVFGVTAGHVVSAGGAYKDNDTPVVGAVTLSKFNDGASVSLDFNRDIITDEDGVPRVAINHGTLWNAEFDFTPKSTTKALAEAELFLAKHGAILTISSMAFEAMNTTWAITGMSIRFVKAGVATYNIRCQRSPEGDIVTLVT